MEVNYASDITFCGTCRLACAAERLRAVQDKSGHEEDAPSKAAYHKISAEEAYEMMASQEVVVVDVRTREEYDGGHIENAVLVPNESIDSEMPEALPDKEATLLIYCRSGRRSKDAAQKLLALGYQSVYDFGGVIDWPYELVKEG